jgi:hypothetical protein
MMAGKISAHRLKILTPQHVFLFPYSKLRERLCSRVVLRSPRRSNPRSDPNGTAIALVIRMTAIPMQLGFDWMLL